MLDLDASAVFDRGNACLERGDPEAAAAAFARCVDLAPDHAGAWFNLANAQARAGRDGEAAASLVRCLRIAPSFGEAHVNLAMALLRLGLVDQAREIARIAALLLPDHVGALACQGGVLHLAGDYAGACEAYRRALRVQPEHVGVLSSLGNTLHAKGRVDEAITAHDRAVALAPEDAICRFNRAMTLLAMGNFEAGWREYEWRWRRPGLGHDAVAPLWRGEALAGRTILLHAEQGLGDTLQFVRYAPMVAAQDGRVLLEVQTPLARLLQGLPDVRVFARGEARPDFEVQCPLMSLPLAFGTTIDSIPAWIPYLRADIGAVTQWRERLGADGAFLVGLAWTGAPHRDDPEAMLLDRRRSMPPAALSGLAGLPGVRLVSLQKDLRSPEIPGLPMIDAMAEMRDFADTAALVGALDLVICVDTAMAHLAGGMGRDVWLLSRFDGCWRWLMERLDTPWYPTMRLYRQTQPGDWAEVIQRVRGDLAAAAGRRCGMSQCSQTSG